jgi:hypothetical protein
MSEGQRTADLPAQHPRRNTARVYAAAIYRFPDHFYGRKRKGKAATKEEMAGYEVLADRYFSEGRNSPSESVSNHRSFKWWPFGVTITVMFFGQSMIRTIRVPAVIAIKFIQAIQIFPTAQKTAAFCYSLLSFGNLVFNILMGL